MYQLPTGARDLLPLDVAQKCWIEQRLQQVFHRWSYQRIITPTLERLDTLMAGGAIQLETVIQLREAEEGALGLRPELTASIARAAVTRMVGVTYPQRLYYNANVFRRNQGSSVSSQQESYQAGVELLGGSGLLADAEVLLLVSDCLNSLGLAEWHLVLGEADLTRSLLATFPLALRDQVRDSIARLDRVALETLSLSPDLQNWALFLLDLRGKPADVVQKVASLDLQPPQRQVLNNLKSLIELLGENFPLTLDLSLIQTFDYYTGIVFEVICNAEGQQVVGRGGRYDQLLGLYHPRAQTTPGIGFSLNIEDLHRVLLPTSQLPHQTPASDWLVVPEGPQAFAAALAYAQHLRAARSDVSLVRVELDLAARSPASVREYARCRRIPQIAWVRAEGTPLIEPVI